MLRRDSIVFSVPNLVHFTEFFITQAFLTIATCFSSFKELYQNGNLNLDRLKKKNEGYCIEPMWEKNVLPFFMIV